MKAIYFYKILLLIVLSLMVLTSCHVVRYFVWNIADQNDQLKFPSNVLSKNKQPFRFYSGAHNQKQHLPDSLTIGKRKFEFEQALLETGTLAFLMVRKDSILYEKYFDNYNESSTISSFSVTKSFVSALVGIAIEEGHIKSVSEPITNYLIELNKPRFNNITIEHLLDMQSGISFDEGLINPFSDLAKFYYGRNIKKYVRKLRVKEEPGKRFEYLSIDAQLLGMIIERATKKTLYEYLQEKIWTPLGMEYDATWNVDSNKDPETKAFCCLNAKARDFAKFGRLYLKMGNWNGLQIIPEEWIKRSTKFEKEKNDFGYSYQWWNNRSMQILTDTTSIISPYKIINGKMKDGKLTQIVAMPGTDFYAEGLLGQFIYVCPEKEIVIVRFGKKHGGVKWNTIFHQISHDI